MVYNLRDVSKNYVMAYFDFIMNKRTKNWTDEEIFALFSYGLSRLLALDGSCFSHRVTVYGERWWNKLKKVKGCPKYVERISFVDKVSMLNLSRAYLVIMLKQGNLEDNVALPEEENYFELKEV